MMHLLPYFPLCPAGMEMQMRTGFPSVLPHVQMRVVMRDRMAMGASVVCMDHRVDMEMRMACLQCIQNRQRGSCHHDAQCSKVLRGDGFV